jgi:hypothetical protein
VGHTDDGSHVIGGTPQVAHQDEHQVVSYMCSLAIPSLLSLVLLQWKFQVFWDVTAC